MFRQLSYDLNEGFKGFFTVRAHSCYSRSRPKVCIEASVCKETEDKRKR